jgi:GNAT superfamily N-acetyltransferase
METIVPASRNDIPHLVALLNVLFTLEADFQPDASRQTVALEHILDFPQTGIILVARTGREVVGMVSLLFTISTAEGGPVCWLEDMIVHPEQRGKGIGARLMAAAIDYARRHDFLRITLLTDTDNSNAQEFYHRQGFRPSTMLVMRLKLAQASS